MCNSDIVDYFSYNTTDEARVGLCERKFSQHQEVGLHYSRRYIIHIQKLSNCSIVTALKFEQFHVADASPYNDETFVCPLSALVRILPNVT